MHTQNRFKMIYMLSSTVTFQMTENNDLWMTPASLKTTVKQSCTDIRLTCFVIRFPLVRVQFKLVGASSDSSTET